MVIWVQISHVEIMEEDKHVETRCGDQSCP